ncbi:aldo/keto reductase [Aestuariibacter halophilus]|uniref:Aldo/keto reductase n=1 Tax=Fluctibacter halophilus TaxID=226011 RepID=A0ABS8GCV2_9ALTE|nr:aldo/keto reductase [Aestuariibacter halophilus]MCC2618213.1 aldo/keto reductase [Aestuariibacter halophilus]
MRYVTLGRSDLRVSPICLGTMTWGQQNTQQDADQQLAMALDHGVNFIDSAEMYPVPPNQDTYGDTERIIGNWLSRHADKRDQLVLATKIAGNGLGYIRGGGDITGAAVQAAVDASLQRLQTDYIDVFQLHWPNRTSPHFGKQWPNQVRFTDVDTEAQRDGMLDILRGLDACVKAGKIRYCGLSDDTPWGISQFLSLSEAHDLPRIVSIQNEFSLLHSKDWPYLIEQCAHEGVAYLPWSPLGGGMLSGKYLNGARPDGSRWTLTQRQGLFRNTPQSEQAVAHYVALAQELGFTPSQLALAWCHQVDGVTSTIIGATSTQQLAEDLAAFDLSLSDEAQAAVAAVIKRFTAPF